MNKIYWNHGMSESGAVLHLITLDNGKSILRTNSELIEMGILARFDARTVKPYKLVDVTKSKGIRTKLITR